MPEAACVQGLHKVTMFEYPVRVEVALDFGPEGAELTEERCLFAALVLEVSV